MVSDTAWDDGKDPRWDKVEHLARSLDAMQIVPDQTSYLVWIDPKAVLVGDSLSVTDMINEHPEAHVITSKGAGPNPMLDTSLVIVRNSKFSRKVMQYWWGTRDTDFDEDEEEDSIPAHRQLVDKHFFEEGPDTRLLQIFSEYEKGEFSGGEKFSIASRKKSINAQKATKNRMALLPPERLGLSGPMHLSALNSLPERSIGKDSLDVAKSYSFIALGGYSEAYAESILSKAVDTSCSADAVDTSLSLSPREILEMSASAFTADLMIEGKELSEALLIDGENTYEDDRKLFPDAKVRVKRLLDFDKKTTQTIQLLDKLCYVYSTLNMKHSTMTIEESTKVAETSARYRDALTDIVALHASLLTSYLDRYRGLIDEVKHKMAKKRKPNIASSVDVVFKEWPQVLSKAVDALARQLTMSYAPTDAVSATVNHQHQIKDESYVEKNEIVDEEGAQMYSEIARTTEISTSKWISMSVTQRSALGDACTGLISELGGIVGEAYMPTLRHAHIQVNNELGLMLFQRGDYSAAKERFEEAVELCGQQPSVNACFLWPSYLSGVTELSVGQYLKAIGTYDAIISVLTPQMPAKQRPKIRSLRGDKYNAHFVLSQDDRKVDAVLLRVIWGRGIALAKQADVEAAQQDLDAGIAFLKRCEEPPFDQDDVKKLKKQLRDEIVDATQMLKARQEQDDVEKPSKQAKIAPAGRQKSIKSERKQAPGDDQQNSLQAAADAAMANLFGDEPSSDEF
jgi:tetratricopeptide (TPR) repeat protein